MNRPTIKIMCFVSLIAVTVFALQTQAFHTQQSKYNNEKKAWVNLNMAPISASVPLTPPDRAEDENDNHNDASTHISFLQLTREISTARNLNLDGVLNARDLATCKHSPIQRGKVFRTGKLSGATSKDITLLMETLQLKTLVDLRSPTELKEDEKLMRSDVFGNFTNVVWKDRGRTKDGCVRVLQQDEFPIKDKFWKRSKKHPQTLIDDMLVGKEELPPPDDCQECDNLGGLLASHLVYQGQRKERLFVPLMSEFKYVKGTLSKLRKRDIVRAVLKSPGSLFSKRVRNSIKKPFLKEINDGGLQMLNELLFRYGAPGIKFVLETCADENRHPVAFYCTAGKDRTGAIAAIILALCKVDLDDIVEDYSLSAHVYADMNDNEAMVGALSQRSLDPEIFLGAPPSVMNDTLLTIRDQFGSVEEYCSWIGFGPEKQQQLRKALLK